MRRLTPVLTVLAIAAGVVAGVTLSAGATGRAPTTHAAMSRASSECGGRVYPAYVRGPQGYYPDDDSSPSGRLFIIKVPSYDAAGSVVGQWPSGCGPDLGSRPTYFLFTSEGPLTTSRAVLPLAKGPPAHDECVSAIQSTADGNVFPLVCANGEVNALAWISYVGLLPRLLTLGRSATRCDVYRAEANDQLTSEEDVTVPETYSAYLLARTYYGWTFTVPSPADPATPTTWERACPART